MGAPALISHSGGKHVAVYAVKVFSLAAGPVDAAGRTSLQRLLDVYGGMLTAHQREACRLHLDEDWSFSEIAEHVGCSRSGAHDLVRRGLAQLERLEQRLGLAAELERRDELESTLRRRLREREAS